MTRFEKTVLGGLVAFVVACLALAIWAFATRPDNSHCDLGPPVYINSGGILVPVYPFMTCVEVSPPSRGNPGSAA